MSNPIIIVELADNNFEGLYSNSEQSFIIVNRPKEEGSINISGPHKSTVLTVDLTRVIDGVIILNNILDLHPSGPFFPLEETP